MSWVRLKHPLDDVYEFLRISSGCKMVKNKLNLFPSKLQFLIIVVELSVVKSYQLHNHQPNGKEVRLKLIKVGLYL